MKWLNELSDKIDFLKVSTGNESLSQISFGQNDYGYVPEKLGNVPTETELVLSNRKSHIRLSCL